VISLFLWSSGWHKISLPFIMPFAVMILIAWTNQKKPTDNQGLK
jgi:hypothetical protein